MRILVTGAEGQVGREVVAAAHAQHYDVLACNKAALDITSETDVHTFFATHDFDVIVNCAAYTAVDKAEEEPSQAYAVNALGVAILAKAAAQKNVPILHLSTDYVFDGLKTEEYVETDSTGPQNFYGLGKYHGELALQKICQKYLILRVSWIFGQHGNNFVKTILRLAGTRDKLSVVDDQIGCPSGAADIARVILHILPSLLSPQAPFGVYHYCSGPEVSWHAFAEAIVAEAHALGLIKPCAIEKIPSHAYPVKAKRPQNSRLNIAKIQREFNIVPGEWRSELRSVLLAWQQATVCG